MASRNTTLLSPLRYPGAKRRLVGYIRSVLKANDMKPELFVEPFAGGAGVSLQLLSEGTVEKIALGEKDELIASFWKTVLEDAEWLVDKIERVEVSLEQWDQFRGSSPEGTRQKALACIFLNRTSFSGILASTAGPLGGRAQESDYTIDCRFNKARIIQRIRDIHALKDRVFFVHAGDWTETIERARKSDFPDHEVFYYFDPPFYEKADRLYRHYFQDRDHKELRDKLLQLSSPWLLSYDSAESIKDLYSLNGHASPISHGGAEVDVVYSASADALRKSQELVITNLATLPEKSD